MKRQREAFKKQLDCEMNDIKFSKQREVMDRLHSITWKQKARSIWNKEMELPLLPLAAICTVICLSLGVKYITNYDYMSHPVTTKADELVEIAGYVYWKDDLEKMVARYEN
jgi:hypothetical protein